VTRGRFLPQATWSREVSAGGRPYSVNAPGRRRTPRSAASLPGTPSPVGFQVRPRQSGVMSLPHHVSHPVSLGREPVRAELDPRPPAVVGEVGLAPQASLRAAALTRLEWGAAVVACQAFRAVRAPRRLAHPISMCGYRWSVGGTNVSLIVRGEVHRSRFSGEPALSLVPEARAPPNGCWPTTAPVGLSLT
jgi:hypothetical protein